MKPTLVRTLLCLVLGAATVSAQIERPIPYPIPKSDAWNKAVAAGTRTNDGSPGAKYWTNFARYTIDAELVPETAKVSGHVRMTYLNRSNAPVGSLFVHLRQNLYKAGNLRNRYVEITGGVTVKDVRFDDQSLGSRYSIRGTVMRVQLPSPIQPGGEGRLSMDWEFQVPKAGRSTPPGVSAIRQGHDSHHVFYLGYWYPQFAVMEDVEGWVAEQYMSNAEFYMGYADYDLKFTVPEAFLVRATGSHVNADEVLTKIALERLAKAREGREVVQIIDRDDLTAGKVTRKSPNGKHTWHFKAENVRDVAVSASDEYVWEASHAVVKDRDGKGKDGKAMIHAVYKPRGRFTGNAAKYARHTIEFMSREVYPYPWPHMTACEGIIGGGMEFPMMTICGQLGQGVVTHELIHMWFPMLVGSNEKERAWQDEGLTSFWTTITQAASKDGDVSRRQRMGAYLRSLDAPMMRHGDLYGEGRSAYGGVSYMKTEVVMRQLQSLIGDELFFKAFRKYAAEWAFKHPYPEDLFHTFSKVAGQDLDWYFRIWFYETWSLDQAIESVKETSDETLVVIADLGMATWPTRVEVKYADDSVEVVDVDVKHWLSGKRTKTLKFKKGVVRVRIDPERLTLDTSRRNDTWRAGQ